MLTITPAQRAADPRPPERTLIVIQESGHLTTARVQPYIQGDGHRTFCARDELAPHLWHDLVVGDPRIIEPAEYGPKRSRP